MHRKLQASSEVDSGHPDIEFLHRNQKSSTTKFGHYLFRGCINLAELTLQEIPFPSELPSQTTASEQSFLGLHCVQETCQIARQMAWGSRGRKCFAIRWGAAHDSGHGMGLWFSSTMFAEAAHKEQLKKGEAKTIRVLRGGNDKNPTASLLLSHGSLSRTQQLDCGGSCVEELSAASGPPARNGS